MTIVDVETLLTPVSEETPCGEALEDSQEFLALENAAQFKSGGALGDDGDTEPDWPDVKRQALALAVRTRDLRVAVHLTAALLRTDGWPGFADGLQLLHEYLNRYWDGVYPLIEDDDPFFRVNALVNLTDPERFVNALRRTPVVSSRAAGAFSLRDQLEAAGGRSEGSEDGVDSAGGGEAPVNPALIRAAFADADTQRLDADAASIDSAALAIAGIETIANTALGTDAPNLSPLADTLRQIKGWMDGERAALRGEGTDEAGDGAAGSGGPSAGLPGAISTPEQAIQALDMVADYFRRREPSSPVPLLLERAKRLVRQDFLALMQDLAPDGVTQARRILGIEDD